MAALRQQADAALYDMADSERTYAQVRSDRAKKPRIERVPLRGTDCP